jgi:hypothetical protein
MADITLAPAGIRQLSSFSILSGLNLVYFALQSLKDPAIANQIINADQFAIDWDISNQKLFSYLQQLNSRKVLKLTPAPLTINWSQQEATSISQAEVLNLYKEKVIDINAYVYYALVLTRTPNQLQQAVDPTFYAATPWNIPTNNLQSAINALSSRKNSDGSSLFQVDLSNIAVTWLI